jgi:hypothetical protein
LHTLILSPSISNKCGLRLVVKSTNPDEVLDQFNARDIRHEVVGDQQVVLFGLNRLPIDGTIFGGVHMATAVNQRVSAQPVCGALIIRHKNAVGRPRLAMQWRAGWLSRWPDLVILHGTTIGSTILLALWGFHPIAVDRRNGLIWPERGKGRASSTLPQQTVREAKEEGR